AENRIGMARVQPDWRFRCLTKVLGTRTVMHHSVMLGRSPRVVGCPPDNCQIGVSPFNFWPLGDLDARSFFSSRGHLRGCWRGVGIRNSLPWVEAEPPDMEVPVKVARLG